MVQDMFRWQDYEAKLMQAFSPGTAISQSNWFRGRRAPIRRIIDAVNQSGQHVAIYGERGVGKTSLANCLAEFLRPFTSEVIASHRVNCTRDSSFQDIWNALFALIGAPQWPPYERLTPNDVLAALPRRQKLILILDEFDRIENPDLDAAFADTIKGLFDFAVDTTLVIVGVADDIDDLIEEHQSIDRCLVQVPLERMNSGELAEIVQSGIEFAGMTVSADAVASICTICLGLPYYAHALGLAVGRVAVDNSRTNIEASDVTTGAANQVRDSQSTIVSRYDLATASPRKENFFTQVLLACALSPTDPTGRFRAADIREAYSNIMRRRYDIPSYVGHLHKLCEAERGAVLQRHGAAHNVRFRFTDPMMQPYVLMQGLQLGLVGLEDARPRTG